MKAAAKKEITIGLLIGLAIGVPALVLALLLSRPGPQSAPEAATVTPAALFESLPTPTPTVAVETGADPEATASSEPGDGAAIETATPPVTRVVTHTVGAGEVLGQIALDFGVSVEAIVAANEIVNPDFVRAGDVLTIPVGGVVADEAEDDGEAEVTATAVPTETVATASTPTVTLELVAAGYPAVLEGNLATAYPGVETTDRFAVHYTPGTYPEADLANVTAMLSRGLAHIETTLDAEIEDSFDVYVAGSLFAAPDLALRGRSFSASRRTFFLHDGTGNPDDQQYISTHEMTHVFAWNVFGRPISAMLSEGVAVYTGMTAIEDADHASHQAFCKAYQAAGRLARVSINLRFGGHIRDLGNYYAAGCFVQYLIETYGTDRFARLYPTGAYTDIYGKSLAALDDEWRAALEDADIEPALDPERLLAASDAVAAAYDALFRSFSADEEDWRAYLGVDAARMALLEGRFDDVTRHLDGLDL